MTLVSQCLRFREMLSAFIGRELRQRYVGSVLGRAWPFLQPMLILGVYYLVFVQILGMEMVDHEKQKVVEELLGEGTAAIFQPLLMACGLLPWMVSAEFVMRCTNTVVENGNLVKKISFPSELLPIYLLGAYGVNLLIMLGLFTVLSLLTVQLFPPLLWLLPAVLLVHALFLTGLGYLLATVNVFVRDAQQLVPLLMNLWFFLTPIFYLKNALKPELAWLYRFNPMAYLIDLYRWVFIIPAPLRQDRVDGVWVNLELSDVFETLGIFAAIATAVFVLGYRTFMAKRHQFADEI